MECYFRAVRSASTKGAVVAAPQPEAARGRAAAVDSVFRPRCTAPADSSHVAGPKARGPNKETVGRGPATGVFRTRLSPVSAPKQLRAEQPSALSCALVPERNLAGRHIRQLWPHVFLCAEMFQLGRVFFRYNRRPSAAVVGDTKEHPPALDRCTQRPSLGLERSQPSRSRPAGPVLARDSGRKQVGLELTRSAPDCTVLS